MPHLSEESWATVWSNLRGTDPLDCWIWVGSRNQAGYGRASLYVDGRRCMVNLPRLMYQHFRAEIDPSWLHVDHLCSNPPCLNPWHLEPVPADLNMKRLMVRGRWRNYYPRPQDARRRGAYTPAYVRMVEEIKVRIIGGELPIGARVRNPSTRALSVNGRGWETVKSWLAEYGLVEIHGREIYVTSTASRRVEPDLMMTPKPVDESPYYERSIRFQGDPGVLVAWPDGESLWMDSDKYAAFTDQQS